MSTLLINQSVHRFRIVLSRSCDIDGKGLGVSINFKYINCVFRNEIRNFCSVSNDREAKRRKERE